MNLDGIVGQLIGILRRKELQQRREAIGQSIVELHLLTLLTLQRALLADGCQCLVNLDKTGRLVEQRAHGLRLGLHLLQELGHGRKADDRLAKLLTLTGILHRLAVGRLTRTDRLCTNTQTGSIHQRHDIFDQTHPTISDQFGRCILIDQFTRRRALNTQLMLDTTHLHAAIALVIDKHRQTACIGRTLLRACQHQRQIAVTIRNEAFHAVEQPTSALLGPRSLQHHGTQIRSGIRLGQGHRPGSTLDRHGEVFGLLLLRAKLIERLGTILQSPDILETGIGTGDHLIDHDRTQQRQVQTAKTTRQSHTIQPGGMESSQIFDRTRGITHPIPLVVRTFTIHRLGIGGQRLATHLTGQLHHTTQRIHRIVKILGSKIILLPLGIAAFAQLQESLHQRMLQLQLQICIIKKEICHYFAFCL